MSLAHISPLLGFDSKLHAERAEEAAGNGEFSGPARQGRCPYLTQRAVPYLLAASDAVYGLASGMTVKFFPVFWIREVQLSPMSVQAMAAAVPFLLALSSYAMHPLAIAIGARSLQKNPFMEALHKRLHR